MAKRIAFSVLCTLLVLVVILTGIAIRRVSRIMLWSAPQDPIATDTPAVTAPPPTTPTVPTEPTRPQHEHSFLLTNSIKPTCEGYGWNIYTCSTCGFVDMPTEERQEPLGHNYSPTETVLPTCTTAGYTTSMCQRCYRIVTENETQPVGHDFTLQREVAPTCTEDGCILLCCSYEGCQEILDSYTLQGTALGHTYGAWTYGLGGLPQPLCRVCFAEWSGTSGGPQPDVYTIINHACRDMRHPTFGAFAMYEIQVGIANDPLAPIYLYTISDYLDNGTLIFYYDSQLGLIIHYNDQDDIPVKIVLDPETEGNVAIALPQEEESEE